MRKWDARAVIFKWMDGVLYLLVVTSRSTDKRFIHRPPQVKFPGGTNTDHTEDGGPPHTSCREGSEETGFLMKKPKFLCKLPPTAKQLERWYYLCAVEDCEGALHEEEITDGPDVLWAHWERADRLKYVLFWTHRPVIREIVRHFGLVG
ncbi:MAG: hypothetical protein WCW47_00185 [Candidatus Paceibacterota bacterium]|jgi:hypothetical protein